MNLADLKRKVRKLKQVEKSIRANGNMRNDIPLVWEKFFDLRDIPNNNALYTLSKLASMNKDEYKSMVDDFFARVYYEAYIYKGINDANIYDPSLLAQLDLSPLADKVAVRKRFRALAKEYHPDAGGDHGKFIALMKIYRDLTNDGDD